MTRGTLTRVVGVVATACVVAAVSWTLAGPAFSDTNGCPHGGTGNPKASNLVGASYTTEGDTAKYFFDSFIDIYDEGANTGIPGLIEYCVYPAPSTGPDSVTVGPDAVGANDVAWVDPANFDNFSIGRPNGSGNRSNIPLDGTMGREMGSASWSGGIPSSQMILLHINDPAECSTLYADSDSAYYDSPETCFVLPGSPPPPEEAALHIRKYYDADADGIHDAGEADIADWQVTYDSTVDYTPVDVDPIAPGNYTVAEGTPIESNWIHTTATSVSIVLANGDDTTVEFGNVCLGAGGGLTLGFWSNRNGQALVGSADLAMLRSLNLVQANGASFDPTTYSQLRNWLLNATAVNMAYMLSAQLAAMELNVYNGLVSGNALIYAPGTTTANSLGFATINAVMAEANTELGVHPTAYDGSLWRSYQETLKNALDKANNNLNFVQAQPCPFSFAS
jgi:hypothetical protein